MSRSDPTGYDLGARERFLQEPDKRVGEGAGGRGEFERDRARVLHSYALRRLAGKTQVVMPGIDAFPRTRLTHSLEVAQIAREMGAALGCDPDVTDTAGLAHDLGHPPFGHNGETALAAVAASTGGFEGNAQTLRILTRLEAKFIDPGGNPAGLNLTRATLDATVKYPWVARTVPATGKFGVYADDRNAFDWIRREAPDPTRRCIEAQVMDWADDVAYSVHDVEDGIHGGAIKLLAIDRDECVALVETARDLYSTRDSDVLMMALDRLLSLQPIRDLLDFDGSYAAFARLKSATSELTGRFVGAATSATRAMCGVGAQTRYSTDLVVPVDVADECALLKAIAARYVMQRPEAEDRRIAQRLVLTELAGALVERGSGALDPMLRPSLEAAPDDDARLRVVVDQIAQLTDASAVAWHTEFVGNGVPAEAAVVAARG
jgi:dGTPase